jgi:hypothetical protein
VEENSGGEGAGMGEPEPKQIGGPDPEISQGGQLGAGEPITEGGGCPCADGGKDSQDRQAGGTMGGGDVRSR